MIVLASVMVAAGMFILMGVWDSRHWQPVAMLSVVATGAFLLIITGIILAGFR